MESVPGTIKQAAAIPVRDDRICLVTAVSGKGWVIPKGCQEAGHTEHQTAKQEAWEEAGLAGTLSAEPVGNYQYRKWGKTCQVSVYLMEVGEVADDWPERSQRQRRWLRPSEALALIIDPGLQQVIRKAFAISEQAGE
jgi:8-oxo-dGTP pyrophosphatase MutT (NUDIX family)